MQDPKYHVLTILDPNVEPHHAIGILLLCRMELGDSGAPVFERHPPTVDHDQARYEAMHKAGDGPFKMYTSGRPFFDVQLLGVDAEYQGIGLGMKLVQKACEISDGEGVDIFAQANTGARRFYEKCGFACLDEVKLQGSITYSFAIVSYGAVKKQ